MQFVIEENLKFDKRSTVPAVEHMAPFTILNQEMESNLSGTPSNQSS